MKTTQALTLSLLLAAGSAFAQAPAPAAATPEWTVAGNASLNSDYRFRGFTQTNYGAALQGGIDIAHSSGFYVGNWNSNVAYYPQSGTDRTGAFIDKKINNQEIYLGVSYGPLSAKLYYATGDYFKTAYLAGPTYTSTKGTTYLDISYTQEVNGLILGAHYGLLNLKRNDQFFMTTGEDLPKSVGDYKLSIGKDIGSGYVLTGAYVGTTKKAYFGTDLGATTAAGKSSVVLSLAKTF